MVYFSCAVCQSSTEVFVPHLNKILAQVGDVIHSHSHCRLPSRKCNVNHSARVRLLVAEVTWRNSRNLWSELLIVLDEETLVQMQKRARRWVRTRRLERQSRSETMEYVWVSPLDHCCAKLILSFHVICQTQYWMYILCWQASSAKTGNLLLNGSLNGLRFMCQKSDLGYLLVFFKNPIFFMISMNILII